jgi:hypothetical protein
MPPTKKAPPSRRALAKARHAAMRCGHMYTAEDGDDGGGNGDSGDTCLRECKVPDGCELVTGCEGDAYEAARTIEGIVPDGCDPWRNGRNASTKIVISDDVVCDSERATNRAWYAFDDCCMCHRAIQPKQHHTNQK